MTKKFNQRTTAPSATDKYWINYTKGGLNECIIISGNSCLPNCTGYAWGRWYELLGTKPKLSKRNAEMWFVTNDGYKRGSTPKLGAIACWSLGVVGNGNDGAGHVAVVEQINKDGSIIVSESNYGGTRWRRVTLNKGYAYGSTRLKFQGFIYPPVEFDDGSKFSVGKNYTLAYNLNVRFGPGTKFAKKTYNQLTPNARKNATKFGVLKAGTVVTCLEVKYTRNQIWIRIPSGWICAQDNGRDYIK